MNLIKAAQSVKGVAILEITLFLPVVLTVILVVADCTRIVMVLIYQYTVLYETMRYSYSTVPPGKTLNAISSIVYPHPNEEQLFPGIGARRVQFWTRSLDPAAAEFHGKNYYTQKELIVFNLAYGFMRDLNSSIYFPIPVTDPAADIAAELQYRTNCSLSFSYKPNNIPNPLPAAPTPPATPPAELTQNRDREYLIECRLPLFVGQIFPFIIPTKFLTIRNKIYSWNSGDIL